MPGGDAVVSPPANERQHVRDVPVTMETSA